MGLYPFRDETFVLWIEANPVRDVTRRGERYALDRVSDRTLSAGTLAKKRDAVPGR